MNMIIDTTISHKFYDCYHMAYPDNLKAMEVYIKSLPVQNEHTEAMLHFISCLESNENVMIYGMLCNAWQKYTSDNVSESDENFKDSVGES